MTCAPNCCGITDIFDEKRARRDLDAYRRRGPSASTARLLTMLRDARRPIDTVLDVGGGVGAIVHELLRSGAARATLVDGSTSYLAAAREESERCATSGKLEVRAGDLVELAAEVPEADVVTLDKVVCCYPDMHSLLASSAGRARSLYGLVYPRDGWWVRLGVAVENRVRRMQGSSFQNWVYANAAIDAAVRGAGLVLRSQHRGAWWVIAVYQREPAPA
jgi:SAM-dependent methyltransferase